MKADSKVLTPHSSSITPDELRCVHPITLEVRHEANGVVLCRTSGWHSSLCPQVSKRSATGTLIFSGFDHSLCSYCSLCTSVSSISHSTASGEYHPSQIALKWKSYMAHMVHGTQAPWVSSVYSERNVGTHVPCR